MVVIQRSWHHIHNEAPDFFLQYVCMRMRIALFVRFLFIAVSCLPASLFGLLIIVDKQCQWILAPSIISRSDGLTFNVLHK